MKVGKYSLALLGLLIISFFCVGCKKKSISCEGLWVDEDGFFCECANGNFRYFDEWNELQSGELSEDKTKLYYLKGSYYDISIEMLSDSSMKINNHVVYRADSEEGKKCIESLQDKILGYWDYEANQKMHYLEITEDKIREIAIVDSAYGILYEWTPENGEEEKYQTYELNGVKMNIKVDEESFEFYIRADSSLKFIDEDGVLRIYASDGYQPN